MLERGEHASFVCFFFVRGSDWGIFDGGGFLRYEVRPWERLVSDGVLKVRGCNMAYPSTRSALIAALWDALWCFAPRCRLIEVAGAGEVEGVDQWVT
jgi:hypothetical protein